METNRNNQIAAALETLQSNLAHWMELRESAIDAYGPGDDVTQFYNGRWWECKLAIGALEALAI